MRRVEVLRKAKPDFDRFNVDLVTEGKTSISMRRVAKAQARELPIADP